MFTLVAAVFYIQAFQELRSGRSQLLCAVSIDSDSCHSRFVALCSVTVDCELIDGGC